VGRPNRGLNEPEIRLNEVVAAEPNAAVDRQAIRGITVPRVNHARSWFGPATELVRSAAQLRRTTEHTEGTEENGAGSVGGEGYWVCDRSSPHSGTGVARVSLRAVFSKS